MNDCQSANYDEILSVLISFETVAENKCNDEIIQKKLEEVLSLLPDKHKEQIKNDWGKIEDSSDVRWKYIILIIFAVKNVKEAQDTDIFSVKQIQIFKKAIEIITLIGIKPNCLLYDNSKDSHDTSNSQEKLHILQRHKRLVFTTDFLLSCLGEPLLKSALLPQFNVILTSLVFISYAQFSPPIQQKSEIGNGDFIMTPELYTDLQKQQAEFRVKLSRVINDCPPSIIMKELMVIHGTKKYPKCVRVPAKKYLIECIMKPFGVSAFIETMCGNDDSIDFGKDWKKLDVASKLLATSQCDIMETYYNAICPQYIEMLTSGTTRQGAIIAKYCIRILYENNPDICINKVFNVIAAPFLTKTSSESYSGAVLRTEQEVTESLENLSRCFAPSEANFKQLPTEILFRITTPLFYLHVKCWKSISALRGKVRQLLQQILSCTKFREHFFEVILEIDTSQEQNYGQKLCFRHGPSGDFEVIDTAIDVSHEQLTDALFDLVCADKSQSSSLFTILLKYLSIFQEGSVDLFEKNKAFLETNGYMEHVERHLLTVTLLTRLARTRNVQESCFENPEPLLSFIKSIFKMESDLEKDADVSYIGLMLVKIIITDKKSPGNWAPFDQFTKFLVKMSESSSEAMKKLIEEVTTLVKTRGRSAHKQYQDLAANDNRQTEFEKALQDLSDPLLPVRAHGLIALTKLIEKADNEAIEKKDVLVCLFQENLKHEDSFLYLAAVNGLCALADHFPESMIELLIQEFIDMPQRAVGGEFSPENRVKLGEILVKTTRALGEMAPKYKTVLINGFLCAARDSDPLVRASSLSCVGELCKILGFRLGNLTIEILYCIGCIIKTDKQPECRRAAVLVCTLLLRGLGKDILSGLGSDLVNLYKALKHLRDNDNDDVLRLHAQLALEEIDDIVKNQLFAKPKLEKTIFLIPDN